MPSVVVPANLPELVSALHDALVGPPGTAPVVALRPLLHDGPLPDGGALVVRTSGSTGDPREVVLPRAALRASVDATAARLGGHGAWLLALPWHHVAGAQVVTRSVVAGTAPHALPDGPFTADAFARAADAMLAAQPAGARAYVSLVPTQLHRLVTSAGVAAGTDGDAPDAGGSDAASGDPGLDALRRFDAVLVGGAAIPPDLLARARRLGVRAVTTYGMSETCGGCVYDGRPLDGVRVALDADGRVSLGGPVVAAGYLGDAAATAASFGPPPDAAAGADRWFRTCDLGAPAPDGTLRVLGRADDVVVTGGEKVAPLAVEHALTAADALWSAPAWTRTAPSGTPRRGGAPEVCVVAVPDPEWGQAVVAVLVDPAADGPARASDALRDAVRQVVAARVAPHAAPRHVLVVPALPLRGPGKIDRRGLAELAAAHLSPLPALPEPVAGARGTGGSGTRPTSTEEH